MIAFRHDTSFPYLAFARRWGLDYGVVLEMADRLHTSQVTEIEHLLSTSRLANGLMRVIVTEYRRRATVAHNALHNGEAP